MQPRLPLYYCDATARSRRRFSRRPAASCHVGMDRTVHRHQRIEVAAAAWPLSLVLLMTDLPSVARAKATALIVFGDSTVDSGNNDGAGKLPALRSRLPRRESHGAVLRWPHVHRLPLGVPRPRQHRACVPRPGVHHQGLRHRRQLRLRRHRPRRCRLRKSHRSCCFHFFCITVHRRLTFESDVLILLAQVCKIISRHVSIFFSNRTNHNKMYENFFVCAFTTRFVSAAAFRTSCNDLYGPPHGLPRQ
jgi:hypothetical protein